MTRQIGLLGALLGSFACGVAAVHAVQAQARPPAYTIAEIEVTDPATFLARLAARHRRVPTAIWRGDALHPLQGGLGGRVE
jgi:hypothetical protein